MDTNINVLDEFGKEKYISKEFAESFRKYLLKYENKI